MSWCKALEYVPLGVPLRLLGARTFRIAHEPQRERRGHTRFLVLESEASLKPTGYSWSCLACRIGHLVRIWQPCTGILAPVMGGCDGSFMEEMRLFGSCRSCDGSLETAAHPPLPREERETCTKIKMMCRAGNKNVLHYDIIHTDIVI
jgi:hypothetical protein